MKEHQQKRGTWSSNFGFLMAAIGSAVGLGNMWGFPYKLGMNGALPSLFCICFWRYSPDTFSP